MTSCIAHLGVMGHIMETLTDPIGTIKDIIETLTNALG